MRHDFHTREQIEELINVEKEVVREMTQEDVQFVRQIIKNLIEHKFLRVRLNEKISNVNLETEQQI